MLWPGAPSGWAQPMITSSTSAGSTPARSIACLAAWPPSFAPWVMLNAPRQDLASGVRAVDTITASVTRTSKKNRGQTPVSNLNDKIESSLAPALARHAHLEDRAVKAVAAVAGLIPEVELRRQDALAGRLHLDVDMARTAGVFGRNDGLQTVAPFGVGELVAAIAKAAVVVLA